MRKRRGLQVGVDFGAKFGRGGCGVDCWGRCVVGSEGNFCLTLPMWGGALEKTCGRSWGVGSVVDLGLGATSMFVRSWADIGPTCGRVREATV